MIYELRKYKVAYGRMDELHDRFKNHTLGLFDKYGLSPVGFWTTVEEKGEEQLIYLLKFENLEERESAWKMFMEDKERIEIWNKSNENGKLVTEITSDILQPTDYSTLQ